MTDAKVRMDALTRLLAGADAAAGPAVEDLCKRSAAKAVNEVLETVLMDAQRDPVRGVLRLRYTEISVPLLERAIHNAIESCCD